MWPERVGILPTSTAKAAVVPFDPSFSTNKFRHLKRVGWATKIIACVTMLGTELISDTMVCESIAKIKIKRASRPQTLVLQKYFYNHQK